MTRDTWDAHLAVPARPDTHGGRHGLVVAEGQLYRPLHLLDVVEILNKNIFVKLRRGSGKDQQGMAPKVKGLKA